MRKITWKMMIITLCIWVFFTLSLIQIIQLFHASLSTFVYVTIAGLIIGLSASVCARICNIYKYSQFLLLNFVFVILLTFFAFIYQSGVRLNNEPIILSSYIVPGFFSLFTGLLTFSLIRKGLEA